MSIYESSVVLLHQGRCPTVAAVLCGEDHEERARQYIVDHPVQNGSYEVQDVEAEVVEHPPTWGVVGERG
jgi:hypothetical protein